MDSAVYADGTRLPGTYTPAAALAAARDRDQGFAWVGLHEPDQHQMQSVADLFGLHHLAVEDAVQAQQRPKLERYDDTLFLVLKTVDYDSDAAGGVTRGIVVTGEIMIFAGRDFVVTVRHGRHGRLAQVRRRMDTASADVKLGSFGVLYAITDHVVDTYRDVTERVAADLDRIEEDVFAPTGFTHPAATTIEDVYLLEREVAELRRTVNPLIPALKHIVSGHDDLISTEVRRYMRDVLNRNVQAADRIAGHGALLSTLLESAVGKVATQQNVDMRKMSAWAAVVSVPTMLSGIYGMRFAHMPELAWLWAYPALLLIISGLCLLLLRNFRRNRWL